MVGPHAEIIRRKPVLPIPYFPWPRGNLAVEAAQGENLFSARGRIMPWISRLGSWRLQVGEVEHGAADQIRRRIRACDA